MNLKPPLKRAQQSRVKAQKFHELEVRDISHQKSICQWKSEVSEKKQKEAEDQITINREEGKAKFDHLKEKNNHVLDRTVK